MPETIPNGIDIVVVGAGTAGATAARIAASGGASVLLVERLPAANVGRKICGNAIADDGVEAIRKYAAAPGGPEIAWHVKGGKIVLPDGETTVSIPRPGLILNRLVFGQRLLADAVAAGALLRDGHTCVGWADRAGPAVRLRGPDGECFEVSARIVIDASGYRAVLTRSGGPSHDDPPSREDVGIGYREIVPLAESIEDADNVHVALSPPGAAGGYAWCFPMGERLANVGIGGPLVSAGAGLREAYRAFANSHRRLLLTSPIDAGSGLLPIRRPLASMVGDGFLSVGDAACLANPLHGGGIAPSILAGALAGKAGVAALSGRDVSASALWEYNRSVMRELGAAHGAHDLLRRFLYRLPPGDFAYVVSALVRSGATRGAAHKGRPRIQVRDALGVLRAAVGRPGLAGVLLRARRIIESAIGLYEDYPATPAKCESWMGRVEYHVRAMTQLGSRTWR